MCCLVWYHYLLITILTSTQPVFVSAVNTKTLSDLFLDEIINNFGKNGKLSRGQFTEFANAFGTTSEIVNNGHITDSDSLCNGTNVKSCNLNKTCLSTDDVFNLFSVDLYINRSTLILALPSLVYSQQNNEFCHRLHTEQKHNKPTIAQAWGYGIGFVSLICFISNIGACLGPIMKTKIFKRVLMFCVALAASTLGATGLLVLIPESMHLTGEDSPVPDYNWKLTTALAGIYIFFVFERVMRIILHKREESMKSKSDFEVDVKLTEGDKEYLENNHEHGHSHIAVIEQDGKKTIAPVAWILLLGDALHNFVDGLSIGAAFTENVYTGISVSLAILCEELPHELGDIAVLLHAGMSIKRALLCNFLAAVVCFAGLIIGILVGESTDGNQWIFAIAGGLFVYISLVDMIPEMNQQAADAERKKTDNPTAVFICQNAGLIFGFIIILLLVNLGGNIRV